MPIVRLQTIASATSRKPATSSPTRLRPRMSGRAAPGAKPGAPRARIELRLFRTGGKSAPRDQLAERLAATGTMRLLRRADTRAAPFPHRVLHEPIFTRMVRDDSENASRAQTVAEHGKRAFE